MHTPSYVPAVDGHGARMYYTGRTTSKQYRPGSRYAIGVLEHRDGRWHRHSEPVVQGRTPRFSVLEPVVIHTDGRYRMWYLANPYEAAPGEQPDYELRCIDSLDGITDWSPPKVFATSAEGFFDNAVARGGAGWVMVLARQNVHGTAGLPEQGLWWTTAPHPSPDRADWSSPERLLDTDHPGTPAWMACATYRPALVFPNSTSTQATIPASGLVHRTGRRSRATSADTPATITADLGVRTANREPL